MKKILCFILMLSLLLTVTACGKSDDKKKPTQNSSGGYSDSDENEYNSTVKDWSNEGGSDGEFDNSGSLAPTPGSSDTVTNLSKPNTDADDDKNPLPENRNFPTTDLTQKDDLEFYYEGNSYVYAIDKNGKEYISYKYVTGELLDVLTGAGKYVLKTKSGANILTTGNVQDYDVFMKDAFPAVTVQYKISGTATDSSVQTTYVFKENCITIASQISANSTTVISNAKSQFIRGFINSYKDCEVKVNSKWIYPSNGDYPYPDFESLCYKHQLTDDIYMYSFMRGEGIPTLYNVNDLPHDEMTMTFESNKGLFYTHEYDLCFVDTAIENHQAPDYRGLFKSLASDFAAGVAPVNNTDDNSTVFVGDEVKLNINVTNLTDDDLKFSLRYDIRDYYGNVVDKGLFIDSTVYKNTGANRNITVKGNYGMYYLNLYVISNYSTYSECYPFALIADYDYKYNSTSPFGINSANTKNNAETENTARLFAKIGVATSRINANMSYLGEQLHKNGITRINGIVASPFEYDGGTETFIKDVEDALKKISPYIDSLEVGNEMNLLVMQGKKTMDEVYPIFYDYTFKKIKNLLASKYPNIEYIPAPFSAGEQAWVDQLTKGYDVDTDGDGIKEHIPEVWSQLTTTSTHVYGNPWMPDEFAIYNPAYKSGTWCIEAALQRLEECFNTYCTDPNEKDFYITELGYPTSAGDPQTVCLRTQADYIVRSGILCSAYGADRIQYYCMYDRSQAKSGFYNKKLENEVLDMNEYNFGLFYEADYYGRFIPKPAGVAFAVMTQQLESIDKNTMHIFDKYDEGYDTNGVRAFKCRTALKGDVTVAYSNYESLPNGKKNSSGLVEDRTPTLPWNSLWTKVDETKFDAVGDKVTVVDIMGNSKVYTAENGKVTIPLTGSPVYIYGVK